MEPLKAILVDCILPETTKDEASFRMVEADNLIKTYGGIVLVERMQKRQTPDYEMFIGKGKAEELMEEAKELDANIVIINNELKPKQVFNLSEYFRKKEVPVQVWDRIDLILKIFQKHASTKEAHLEIELASIRHMGPRIFGMGMELSRQGGGIGTRGKGETNIEIMRRHLKEHERKVKKQLEDCKKNRQLQLDARKRQNFKTVGIVGYTNAGKSSLLNALTKKGAYVADALFATLDTRVGRVYLHDVGKEVLFSDTIGFIQDLPHTLIESFHSTLAETKQADLLLHVIDVSDPKMNEKIEVVHEVLAQIDAEDKPMLYVFNKIDQGVVESRESLRERFAEHTPVFISAFRKEGLEELKRMVGERLFPGEKLPGYSA